MSGIWSVFELTSAIRESLELQFPFIRVKGQVFNLSRPGSGHIYFTLKDERAGLQVVWFKNSHGFSRGQGADPASTLENGQDVVCTGKISVYPPRGSYQLIAEFVQEQGLGDLFLAFEALKNKLLKQGYFDEARKRPIPWCPDRLAMVTAPSGAVIHDFMRVAEDLGLGSQIRVYPAQVQGDKAPADIVRAIQTANQEGWGQVLVLIRGGGSLEDLWAFNDEQVARAVYESAMPVLTGIGHETDTTIADLTADRRTATPSQAAQVLWPRRKDMALGVDEIENQLVRNYSAFIQKQETGLDHLHKALSWVSPANHLLRMEEKLKVLDKGLRRAGEQFLQNTGDRLKKLEERLSARMGPEYWEIRLNNLDFIKQRLSSAAGMLVQKYDNRLALAEEKISGLDPYAPLKRGYALVSVEKSGAFLRSADDVSPGDRLDIAVSDGRVESIVSQSLKNK